jgi:hypothetical protein
MKQPKVVCIANTDGGAKEGVVRGDCGGGELGDGGDAAEAAAVEGVEGEEGGC